MANRQNFTTIGVPQFQGGFNQNFSLPITGEGIINKLDRTKQQINRNSQKAKTVKRFTSPAMQWGQNKTNTIIQQTRNNKQYKRKTSQENKETQLRITPLNLEQARTSYSKGQSGLGDVISTYIYHIVMPESMKMPHSEGLKDQLAAAVAFDQSSEGFKQKRPNGDSMIGYPTYGILSNSDLNINKQKTLGNGASKIMGGVTYTINGNKVQFDDKYKFGVYRTVDSNGQVHAYLDNNDPYKGSPWKGLLSDLSNISKLGIQNIAENFGTRQGKSRDNSLQMSIDEINSRNTKNLKPITINSNYWNNYQDFK